MSEFNKYSTDGGATFIDVEDSNAVHWGDQSKGYVGKNLLKISNTTKTVNNVTFTINNDGSVLVNGTASANIFFNLIQGQAAYNDDVDYILTGCPSGGSGSTYALRWNTGTSTPIDIGSGVTIPAGTGDALYIEIRIQSGYVCNNLLFKPMLRLASIPDSTYEPYLTPNTDLMSYADNAISGVKNYCKNTGGNQTINTVVFTVDSLGVINANGTSNADYTNYVGTRTAAYTSALENGKSYVFKGMSTAITNVDCNIYDETDNRTIGRDTDGSGVLFTYDSSHKYAFGIEIRANGVALSNVKFYPIIQLADDTDTTWKPYAMTNRELTLKEHTFDGTTDANGVVVASSIPNHPIVYCYGEPTGGGNCFVEARPGGGGIAFYCHNNGTKVASSGMKIYYYDYLD